MVKKQSFLRALISASGVGIVANAIGFLRQVLIAAYFGVSRELDIYFMSLAIAMLVVFPFGMIFDTVGIPHLIRTREEKGEEAFKRLTGSIFSFSVLFGILASAVFIALTPLIAKFMAAGFSGDERKVVWEMAFYILPWTLIMLPYYALCSFYKSRSNFNIVFIAEVIISVFSVLALIAYHPNPRFLPVAFFIGHLAAFIMLFAFSFGLFERMGRVFIPEMKRVYKNFFELFGANQVSSLSSLVERFFQSFLQPGGISALSYSGQLTMTASGFLSFREIFIVPLSEREHRAEKMERLIIGLVVITIPVMVFCSYFAGDIIAILFKRGRFDISAAGMTSVVFSIYILSLLPSTAGLPVFRMFQVIDRIKNVGYVYLFGGGVFAVLGPLFVFYLKMGVIGLALIVVLNSYLSQVFSFYLMRKAGITLNHSRILKYASYSVAGCLAAIGVMRLLPELERPLFIRFLINGLVYFALVALTYLPLRKRLVKIVYD